MFDKKTLTKIKQYFAKQKDVVAVYLYGSQVTGKSAKKEKDRDIDFAVLFVKPKKSYSRQFEVGAKLQKIIGRRRIDCREVYPQISPLFLMNVLKNSQLIYSSNENKRIVFEVNIMREYEDTQNLRDLQYFYLQKRLKEEKYANPN